MSLRDQRRKRVERLDAAPPNFRLRSTLLLGFLGLFLIAVIASAFQRQVVEREFLQQEGADRYLRDREIPARRGMILDRNGEPLAVSSPVSSVWANPRKLVRMPDAIADLAEAMGMERSALKKRIEERRTKAFIYLKRRIAPEQAKAVAQVKNQYKIRELGLQTEYRRFYPSGQVRRNRRSRTHPLDPGAAR